MAERAWYRRGPDMGQLPSGREPSSGEALGTPEDEPLGVFLALEATDIIDKHLMAEPEMEAGGILVGHVARSERPFVLVSGAIEARFAERVSSGINLTDRSWEYMQSIWQRDYPDTVVVGWFCSHPDQGVELTSYDRFTQHRFFDHPWQIALIVDTIRNISVLYRWSDNQLTPLSSFTVWDSRQERIDQLVNARNLPYSLPRRPERIAPSPALPAERSEQVREINRPTREVEEDTKYRLSSPLAWAIVLALLLIFLLWPSFPWSITHLWSSANQRQEELSQLQDQLQQTRLQLADPDGLPNLEPRSASNLGTGISDTSLARASPGQTYRVQPGDTLWEISRQLMGNPLEYPRLAAVNDIENPSLIHPGTDLTFPDMTLTPITEKQELSQDRPVAQHAR